MKKIQTLGLASVLMAAFFISGCATDNAKSGSSGEVVIKAPPLPDGVKLHEDKDIQGVWTASGFDFKGFDTLYVGPTAFMAIERPNEKKIREHAIIAIQEEFLSAARDSSLFKSVVISSNDIPATGRAMELKNIIIEYEKGGGAARYWAGLFGGGQPVVKVRGLIYEGDKLLAVFEAKRSGESAGARVAGVWLSDEEIQNNDIRDLASDVVEWMRRTAGISDKK